MGTLAVAAGLNLASCGNKNKVNPLQSTVDSLSQSDSLHAEDVKVMTAFVNYMSDGVDSLASQEGILLNMTQNPEGKRIDKAKFRAQLDAFAKLIDNQRSHISDLERQLANSKTANSAYGKKIQKLISYYKAQLEEKDKTIAQLRADLNEKDANIAKLNQDVSNLNAANTKLNDTNTKLNQTVASQQNVMNEQDQTIHTAFTCIGTSKQLKEKGLIKGGFLQKKKVQVSNFDASKFTKIDIRNYNDIVLNSRKPTIMTQMPASSYTLTENANGTTTLHIKDASLFWSVSKYLIIKL
jgi:chromosome segregation ATPase